MDDSTLQKLAELICGDDAEIAPVYRSGGQLTQFFDRAGLPHLRHDGTTRKWWTLEALRLCGSAEKAAVIKRLASPKEYGGDPGQIRKAVTALNLLLRVECLRVELKGVEPLIAKIKKPVFYDLKEEVELKPLPPPDFLKLGLEQGVGELLAQRWDEAQRNVDGKSYLSAIIMMGSLLEGLLLGTLQKNPRLANQASSTPKDATSGKPKPFWQWTLAEMIEVAHTLGWLGLDVKKFSHALREFRNLIHPYEQLATKANPDEDTCKISWLVVQAAVNDLAKILAG